LYDPTAWPGVGPFFKALNQVLESTGVPHATVALPGAAILALLFLWIIIRLIRRRRAGEKPAAAKPRTVKAAAEEMPEEAPEDAIDDALIERELEAEMEAAGELAPEFEEEAAEPAVPAPKRTLEAVKPLPVKAVAEAEAVEEKIVEAPKLSLFARLRQGLSKTAGGLVGRIDALVRGRKIDPEFFAELEEILFTADLGPNTADKLLAKCQQRVKDEKIEDAEKIRDILKEEIRAILLPHAVPLAAEADKPFTIMVVGVNGVGKTTTIGKIASKLIGEGKTVIMGAADTFRAAADEQLTIWSERVGAEIVRQKSGADPSAVAYDAVQAAKNRNVDVVIIDTAGRLHTKHNLMEELKKVKRVMNKVHPGAPHEILLIIDANTGQNAITQAQTFHEALGLTGLILTKLDGTAKGGCLVGICEELTVPIRFIGIGEKMDDLRPFNAEDFVEALFDTGK